MSAPVKSTEEKKKRKNFRYFWNERCEKNVTKRIDLTSTIDIESGVRFTDTIYRGGEWGTEKELFGVEQKPSVVFFPSLFHFFVFSISFT